MTTATNNTSAISWTPIKKHFGAEVDIDLNLDMSELQIEGLRQLFDERQLLIFRNQNIDYDRQRQAVAIFGELLPAAGDAKYVSTVHDVEGNVVEEARDIDPRAAEFHSDFTFMPSVPVRGISLFGEDVSDTTARVEGTRFISARQAYLNLPENARDELADRTLIHLHALGLSVEDQKGLRDRPFDEIKDEVDFWAEHPVFFSTGSKEPNLFYIPWFAHSIVGMTPAESRKWFDLFDEVLYQQEDIYTHKWQQNDLVLWDNVALQHGKEPTVDGAGPVPKRVLRRAIFGTEAPNIYKAGYSFDAELTKRNEQAL